MPVNTWTVVHFEKDNSVEAVPTIWVNKYNEDTMCSWPPFVGEALTQAMKKCLQPEETWKLFKCRIFKHGTFDDYVYARKKAAKAEVTSDLSSTDTDVQGMKRKIKPVIRSSSSSSSSDDERDMPSAPSVQGFKRFKNTSAEQTSTTEYVFPKISYSSENTLSTNNIHAAALSFSSTPKRRINKPIIQVSQDVSFTTSTNDSAANIPLADENSQDDSFATLTNSAIQNETCRCCHHQQQIIDCLNKIIRKQSIERGALTQLLTDVAEIKKKLDNPSSSDLVIIEEDSIFKKLELPITEVSEMVRLENYLGDEEAMKRAQIEISRIGGDNPADFIRRAIPRVIDDEVCRQYNWEGKKGKNPLKKLKTAELLLGALSIRGVQEEKKATQLIKNFIKNSSERIKQKANKI